MKTELTVNKQLFNIKELVYGKTPEELVNGQAGIFAIDSPTSIASTVVTFSAMPAKTRIIAKHNGKLYVSLAEIDKNRISSLNSRAPRDQTANVWKTTLKSPVTVKSANFQVRITNSQLTQQEGMLWSHMDSFVVDAPAEISQATVHLSAYENNIMTKLLGEKINAQGSEFYEASYETAAGVAIPDIDAFIATNLVVNSKAPPTTVITDAYVYAVLVVKSKIQGADKLYHDLENAEIYPMGTAIVPFISFNERDVVPVIVETQTLLQSLNSGYDLRSMEHDAMSLYTNLLNHPRTYDGFANQELLYQFENGVKYYTLNFNVDEDKFIRSGSADTRQCNILLGTSTASIWTKLKTLFTKI